MVFSNHYPNLKKLSRDRWVLLHPNKDGLKDVLDLYKKNREKAKGRAPLIWIDEKGNLLNNLNIDK